MNTQIDDNTSLPLQSARWRERMRAGKFASQEVRKGYIDFVTGSEAALSQTTSDELVDDILRDAQPWGHQTLEETLELARQALADEDREAALAAAGAAAQRDTAVVSNFRSRQDSAERVAAPSRRYAGFAVAAAVSLAIVGASVFMSRDSDDAKAGSIRHYVASGALPDIEELKDGTRAVLSPGTAIDTQFTDDARIVELRAGTALFDVAKDVNRQFSVHTPHGVMRALGTKFSVTVGDGRTEVVVKEGRVSASGTSPAGETLLLASGDSAELSKSHAVRIASGTGPDEAASAATAKPLIRAPLSEVGKAVNDVQKRHVLDVRGEACNSPISGVLNLANEQEVLAEITADGKLVSERQGDVYVIRLRDTEGGTDASCTGAP